MMMMPLLYESRKVTGETHSLRYYIHMYKENLIDRFRATLYKLFWGLLLKQTKSKYLVVQRAKFGCLEHCSQSSRKTDMYSNV